MDGELVRRKLFGDTDQARAAVAVHRVLVSGVIATNPSRLVSESEPVRLVIPARFVSRAGEKLDAALDAFDIDVTDRRAYDVGSSTGGFTDCLLQRGAAAVVAVDVGTNQLHERLRSDPRVTVHERTNIRAVEAGALGPRAALVVADLSFISLRSIVDRLVTLAAHDADLVVLVKPQFEAERQEADRGAGIIRVPAIWLRVLDEVAGALRAAGATIMGAMPSPLRGSHGNVEFLLHARTSTDRVVSDGDSALMFQRAVDEAEHG